MSMRFPTLLLLALTLSVSVLLLGALPVLADEHGIEGRVVNRTPNGEPPAGVTVTLTVFEGETAIGQLSTDTDADGAFLFDGVARVSGVAYLFQLIYQGAEYRAELDLADPRPMEIGVYDSTSELGALSVVDDTIMVTRDPDQFERLTVRQVVRVSNETQETFVPSFGDAGAGVMNFLRVSMPAGFTEMSVRSDLRGGQVIPVERGVGITTAVPPGIHAIVFSYAVPYDGSELIFEPLYPLGAGSVRALVREDVGRLIGPELSEEAPVEVSGSSFRVYSVQQVESNSRVTLGFTDLPQPPLTTTIADAFTTQWQVTALIPGVTALLFLLLLGYAWRLQKRDPRPIDPAALTRNLESQPDQMDLVSQIAGLDAQAEQGGLSEDAYRERRGALKQSLLSRALKDASSA